VRIAVVVWDLTISGGTQRQALELAVRLAGRHEVVVVAHAFDQAQCHPDLSASLDVRHVGTVAKRRHRPTSGLRHQWAYDAWGQFRQVTDDDYAAVAELVPLDVDVVNVHDLHTERVAWHLHRRRDKLGAPRVPVVWMSNDVPLVHQIRTPRPPRWQGVLGEVLGFGQRRLYDLEVRRERRYTTAVDTTVVLDQRNQLQVRERVGLESVIVRSGLDVDRFQPRYVKDNAVFTLLGTGILFRLRRFEDVIDAVALLRAEGRELRFDVIGRTDQEPSYAAELSSQVERLGLTGSVTFHGGVSETELLARYRDSDVFVFANHEQTWGLAVFEAMASGTPVVVSRTAGAHEVLTDGVDAVLVPPKDPPALARAIADLMDDAERRTSLARAGRAFVEAHITWDLYASRMEELFDQARRDVHVR
jgi:glycosyltransferase involved in cell wall biosynthesis